MLMTEEEKRKVLYLSEEDKKIRLRKFIKEIGETINEINAKDNDFYKIYLDKISYVADFIGNAFVSDGVYYCADEKHDRLARNCICYHSDTKKELLIQSLKKMSRLCEKCVRELEKHGDGSIHL